MQGSPLRKRVEKVVFTQVQVARRHNTLCPLCCDWFLLILSWRAQARNVRIRATKEGVGSLYMSWDPSIYRLQLPSLLLSPLSSRPPCLCQTGRQLVGPAVAGFGGPTSDRGAPGRPRSVPGWPSKLAGGPLHSRVISGASGRPSCKVSKGTARGHPSWLRGGSGVTPRTPHVPG